MDDAITRAEHEEFRKRLEEQNQRQNKRLDILEANVIEMGQLTTTVAKLAVSMDSLIKNQGQQDERLKALEGRDGEMWRKVAGYIVTTVVGVVLGFIFTRIGL